jgi:hypothetical protein
MVADSSLPPMSPRAQEIFEQLLALADKIGAASADASRKLGGAYVEAFQKLALDVGNLQGGLTDQGGPTGLGAFALSPNVLEGFSSAKERMLEMGEKLCDASINVTLAYVDASVRAALVTADCDEELAATSSEDVLKKIAEARAELLRTVARSSRDTLRAIVS